MANTGPPRLRAFDGSRKPRILLMATGSVAAVQFAILCHCFAEWAEVKAVATSAAIRFVDIPSIPTSVKLYTDQDEWAIWRKIGDGILHIELRRWADILVIAPLSANTLGKIANGLCDNLVTCIVRAWDYSKPLFVAPSMNSMMWQNVFTERHLMAIDELGVAMIPPKGGGDQGMAEPSDINTAVRILYESRKHSSL